MFRKKGLNQKIIKNFGKLYKKVRKNFTKKSKSPLYRIFRQIQRSALRLLVMTVRPLLVAMVRVVEMKYFRSIAIALLVIFIAANGVYFVKSAIYQNAEGDLNQASPHVMKIRVVEKGKVVDIDQVQIYEKEVESGDTILGFLLGIGLEENESVDVLRSLKKELDPRDIVVGNKMIARYKAKIEYDKTGYVAKKKVFLDEFAIVKSPEINYLVKKSGDSYIAKRIVVELSKKITIYKGVVKEGLFVDAAQAGASANAVMNMIALYGYDVDFQRDIRGGDEFEIVVESYHNKGGKRVKDGNILFARLDLANKKEIAMYAHRMKNGSLQYFDKKGYSVKKSLLKTPINGARVSSGFGMRRHPVLGYSKLHKGVDFAARTGTPIFAAGDGVIVRRLWNGGYGRYIKIKHNSTYQTAYAHMSRFNRRFKRGSRVKQGDVIGYVGTTGRSTGPHLHFEVIRKGRAINPAKVKAVSGTRLKGRVLKDFKKTVNKIEKHRKSKKG